MKSIGWLAAALGIAGAAVAQEPEAQRHTIAVIGTGSVGSMLGTEWGERGHTIVYGSRNPDRPEVAELVKRSGADARATSPAEAARDASIILFAVRWKGAEASAKSLGDVRGKIVIDVSNPVDFERGKLVHVPVIGSGAEQLQKWLPGAKVVKAFNALNYRIMGDPQLGGGPVTIPLASDDEQAKAVVAQLVEALGHTPYDAGALANSRYLEGMAILYVDAQMRRQPFEYHLRRR